MNGIDALAVQVRAAELWVELAMRQIDSGAWIPNPDERATAISVLNAVERPVGPRPSDPLLRRLIRWAPLADPDRATELARRVSSPTSVTLADLLSTVRCVVTGARGWQRRRLDLDAVTLLEDVDALMVSFTDVLVRASGPLPTTRRSTTRAKPTPRRMAPRHVVRRVQHPPLDA